MRDKNTLLALARSGDNTATIELLAILCEQQQTTAEDIPAIDVQRKRIDGMLAMIEDWKRAQHEINANHRERLQKLEPFTAKTDDNFLAFKNRIDEMERKLIAASLLPDPAFQPGTGNPPPVSPGPLDRTVY